MKQEYFVIPSSNKQYKLQLYLFLPEKNKPRAVIQLVHGICEHMGLYQDFVSAMCNHGIAVCGCDLLGHGATAELNRKRLGVMGDGSSWQYLIQDQIDISVWIRNRFQSIPIYLLGHSMGSCIARLAASSGQFTYRGLILTGTAGPDFRYKQNYFLASLALLFNGPNKTSVFFYKKTLGVMNQKVTGNPFGNEWVSHDTAYLKRLADDPWCSFLFSNQSIADLMMILIRCNRRSCYTGFQKLFPILFLSGSEDPLGKYGKGVLVVYKKLVRSGCFCSLTIFEGDRHNVFQESHRNDLIQHVLDFIQ